MKFTTESGTTFLYEGNWLTRLPGTDPRAEPLRRDGEPVFVVGELSELVVGKPVMFLLRLREDGLMTTRTTSRVVSIEGDNP